MAGFAIIEINIEENPLLEKFNEKSSVAEIPSWIKNNAGWWAEGIIDDEAFVNGIQFLINEKIIQVSSTSQEPAKNNEIPSWIKNNAGWWAEGIIDDEAFVNGIQYLVEQGIIQT